MAINIINSTGSHAELIVKLKEKSVTIFSSSKNIRMKWINGFSIFFSWVLNTVEVVVEKMKMKMPSL